jgi:hypothetical protein
MPFPLIEKEYRKPAGMIQAARTKRGQRLGGNFCRKDAKNAEKKVKDQRLKIKD